MCEIVYVVAALSQTMDAVDLLMSTNREGWVRETINVCLC